MAYAALISLANTIDHFLNHNNFSISLEEKQQIISLLEYVTPFQTFLEKFAEKFNSLERRMRDVANEAEDLLEYFVLEKVSPSSIDESKFHPSKEHEPLLKRVMVEIDLIAKEVKEINESKDGQRAADTSAALSSSSTAPPIQRDVMVGFEDFVTDLKDRLCGEPSKLQVIPICGMGGIGKTTLARNVYDDPVIIRHFVIRVWLTISQDYSAQRILSSVVESLKEYNTGRLGQSDDEKVHKILKGRRYLIVMDDIWSSEAWDVLRRVSPDDGNGSRVMLTTRLFDVASYPASSSKLYRMGLLDAYKSWKLFRQKVFGDENCPTEFESIGKEISRSCKGLPLAIVVIAGLISTTSRSVASWKDIAEKVKSAEHDQIEETLSLSYTQLPQYLRPCFLYMGSFPEDEEIHVKKLIRLWIAEGFIKSPTDSDSLEKVAEECLEELMKRNLVLVTKRTYDGRIKCCRLHDLMRELSIRKAHESNFFLNVMDKLHIEKECFMESIRNQRRVSIKSSYLSYLSTGDDASTIHSIRCSEYRLVKLDFVKRPVRLLRVLDMEPIYVEDSTSTSVHQLCESFHLRYLAIRHMSSSISRALPKLQNLQTLIVCEKGGLKIRGEVFNLGLSWCMTQLRHVYFHGTVYFVDTQETTCSLENLQTLSHLRHWCCSEGILKRIPNLKHLKIDCADVRHCEHTAWLNDLVHLHRLETLEIYSGRRVHLRPLHYKITFPRMLRRLTFRDLRLPWNNIFVVDSLPNLQVLKLKGCTCVGGTWGTTEGAFPVLEVLLIKNSMLKNWITESSHFPKLKRLLVHYCWDLNKIPNGIGEIPTLELIEVKGYVDSSLVESAELIRQEQEELGNTLQVLCRADDFDKDSHSWEFYFNF